MLESPRGRYHREIYLITCCYGQSRSGLLVACNHPEQSREVTSIFFRYYFGDSRNISLIVVLLLAPIALWYWMQYCGNKMLDTDYATVGADTMFQRQKSRRPQRQIIQPVRR